MINHAAIACLLSAAVAGGGAWAWQANSYGRELADMRSSIAELDRLRARAAATALQAAQVRGNILTSDLLARQQQIDRIQKARHAELARLTTGRPCLSADAVGVLNEQAGSGSGVPQATGITAATGATFATDADVGQWAADARASYDTCRSRLDALIDWHSQK